MPIEDFEIKESLGKGSFGSVVKVVRKSDQQVYAMKQIKLKKLKQKDKRNALNQVRFLASLNHPYIVGYREAFYDQQTQNLCVVMDFANEGDLQAKIKKHLTARLRIKQQEIWKICYELIQGLNKIHDSNIIHRDLKPANIFFHNGVAKIGDLNVAKHLKDPFTVTQTGTPYYASPEVWNQEPYDYKSDIWSLGCVIYQMVALKPPFRAETPEKLYKKVMSGQYDPIPACYTKQLQKFIAKLLSPNQKIRPSCSQLLCDINIMEVKQQIQDQNQVHKELLKTIKFPNNIKQLNEKLPKAQYGQDSSQARSKTAKIIKLGDNIKQNSSSKILISNPSLKLIACSQKNIGIGQLRSVKQLMRLQSKRLGGLQKNGSQKFIT